MARPGHPGAQRFVRGEPPALTAAETVNRIDSLSDSLVDCAPHCWERRCRQWQRAPESSKALANSQAKGGVLMMWCRLHKPGLLAVVPLVVLLVVALAYGQ